MYAFFSTKDSFGPRKKVHQPSLNPSQWPYTNLRTNTHTNLRTNIHTNTQIHFNHFKNLDAVGQFG